MRVLLIDKDKAANQGLAFFLKGRGFVVDPSFSGEDGAEMARLYDYDLILMEPNPAAKIGSDTLRKMRAVGVRSPVIILSGAISVPEKVDYFNAGADDYLVRPYERLELLARMQAVIRRARGYDNNIIRIGAMEVNLDTKAVLVNGKVLPLTGKEYGLLELLCLRRGMTVTKEQFLNHLYGGMDEPEMKIIDVFLCRIRNKIARLADGKQYIRTIWGRGYILQDCDEIKK